MPHFYDYHKENGFPQEDSISINHFANLLQLLIYIDVFTYDTPTKMKDNRFRLSDIQQFVKKHRSDQNMNPPANLQSKNTQLV